MEDNKCFYFSYKFSSIFFFELYTKKIKLTFMQVLRRVKIWGGHVYKITLYVYKPSSLSQITMAINSHVRVVNHVFREHKQRSRRRRPAVKLLNGVCFDRRVYLCRLFSHQPRVTPSSLTNADAVAVRTLVKRIGWI